MNYAFVYLLKAKVSDSQLSRFIGTLDELRETAKCLKSEFEMKDLGKIRFCLTLELEHCDSEILIHQSTYT
jgi:hypothetical protein